MPERSPLFAIITPWAAALFGLLLSVAGCKSRGHEVSQSQNSDGDLGAAENVAGKRPDIGDALNLTSVTPINDIGPAVKGNIRYSPVYGIAYQDNGFNPAGSNVSLRDSRLKTMADSINYFRSLGISESVIGDFKQYATDIITVPDQIGKEIDLAYETIYARWNICGGSYASTINKYNRGGLLITVQPSIWYQCGTTAGCSYIGGLEVGDKLYTTVVYVGVSNPAASRVTKFRDIVRWEMGNAVATYSGHRPRTTSQEMGDQSPCGQNVGPSPLPPPAPKNLSLKADSHSQVTLAWISGGGTTTGFYVTHAEGTAAPKCSATGFKVQVPGASIGALKAGTQYAFSVCAANSANVLSSALTGATRTLVDTTPAPPANLSAKAVSPTDIALSWSAGANAKTHYVAFVEGATAPACDKSSISAAGSSFTASKLKPETEYSFSVCSVNALGQLSPAVSAREKTFATCNPVLQNKNNNMDVNSDGVVSSMDALLIVNHLNSKPSVFIHDVPSVAPFLDVNGDCFITSIDGLNVINYLNKKN